MNLPLGKSVELKILSLPAHLPVVRAATERMCQMVGFDAEMTGGVVLSVDEALTNIIKHAYDKAEDRPIDIELAPFRNGRKQGLRIVLRDYGKVVDRSRIKSRDLSDIRPGGLGVHIINQCMDLVDYRPAAGGGTRLTMEKSIPCNREGEP